MNRYHLLAAEIFGYSRYGLLLEREKKPLSRYSEHLRRERGDKESFDE